MSKKTSTAAANKVNAPAIKDNGNATSGNANKGGNKGNKARKDTSKAAPVMDGAKIASTAAAWLKSYKSVRGIKDTSATLISQHGRETYNAILAACKATRAAEISTYHTETRAALSYDAVLEREFNALKGGKAWRNWCALAAAKWDTAAAFVAACYPSVLTDGKPARAVRYTNGKTIYRAFRPIEWASAGGAVLVLEKALDQFKKAHTNAADKGKDGGALVINKVYTDGQAVAAYNAVTETHTDKDGNKYPVLVSAGAAKIDAATLAKINVKSAGKDGHRLPTLAEFNADLRK